MIEANTKDNQKDGKKSQKQRQPEPRRWTASDVRTYIRSYSFLDTYSHKGGTDPSQRGMPRNVWFLLFVVAQRAIMSSFGSKQAVRRADRRTSRRAVGRAGHPADRSAGRQTDRQKCGDKAGNSAKLCGRAGETAFSFHQSPVAQR